MTEVSSIIAVQTGTPVWVYNTNPADAPVNPGDYNLDGNNWDVHDKPTANCTVSHSRSAYINGIFTAADFPVPAAGTEGNEPRNIYRNPDYFQIDASLLKNNHLPWLGERGNLQFRFDFINLFNHGNLGPVDDDMAHGRFGQVHTALPARALQLGLQIAF
jgi:hypothetical protein